MITIGSMPPIENGMTEKMPDITDLSTARKVLEDLLEGNERICVLTGAGISTESGIPDYRSPGGIWSKMQPIQFDAFVHDKVQRLEDWRRRFKMMADFNKAEPNAAHLALAALARLGQLDLLITQNIDGLHQRAETPVDRLVELHGNGTRAACISCGRPEDLMAQEQIVATGQSPRCQSCGDLLKAAVISFGQQMPEEELRRAAEAAHGSDVFLAIGSSLQVHPAAQLPVIAANAGARLIIVNREPTPVDCVADFSIRTPIAESFAALSGKLSG